MIQPCRDCGRTDLGCEPGYFHTGDDFEPPYCLALAKEMSMTHTDTTTITPVKLYTLKQGAKFIFPDDTTKTVFIAGKPRIDPTSGPCRAARRRCGRPPHRER